MSKTGTDLEAMRLAVLNSLRKNQPPASESQKASGESSTPTAAPAPTMSTSEQPTSNNAPEEVETAEQGPSVSKDKELKEAIMDLRKLGLSYSDILFQAKVDPLFLSNVFGSMDFPVPKPPPRTTAATSTATASATTNTTITTTTTNSAEKRSASLSSSGGGASSNIPPKEPAQNTVEPPSRPKSVPGLSQSQVPSRAPSRFGSDRWSQKLNIEVSDDEESDNESAAGSRQSSVNGCRSAKSNAPLKEKLRLEKEISELMRKMEAQKGVKNQQRKAAGTSPSVTPPIADSQPSSSGMSTPADSSRVSSTPVAPAQELRNKWAQALKRREEVRKRVSEYESKLNEFNVSNIEKEVDQLKRLLEEKMKAVMEAAYQSASVRAQHEAAERENAAAENEVKELEQQMLEIERQQQQEQQQGQKKEEEMHQKEVEITLQKKETVDENLHEECAAEEMELDDQPLQPAEDVTMNDNGGSDVQDASAAATDANMTQQKPENLPPLSTTDAGEQGTAQEDMAKSNNDVSTATETVKVSATVQHNEHNTRPEAVKMDVRGPSETTKESETVHVSTTIGNTEQNVQSESKETGHRDLPEKKKESETFQSSATVQSTEQNSQSEPMQVDRPDDSETGGESRPIEIDSSQPEDEEMSEAPETIPDTKIKGEDTTQGSVNMSSDKHIEVVDLLSDSEDEAAQPLPANETHHQEKAPTAVQPQAQDTTSAIQPQIQETTTTFQHQSQENASSVNPQFEDAHSPEPPSKDGAHVAENENQQPNEAEKKCSTVEDELDHPVKRKFYDMELDLPIKFVKYISPLRRFRSFRFSPVYLDHVGAEGYRSKTYSVKPAAALSDKTLCTNELAGKQCHNNECQMIHFDDLIMSDQDILGTMSRAFIGNSSQEIEDYRESLTKMLRDGNMSEFEDIAKAIVDFRADRASKECRILDWHKFKSKKR